MTLSRWLARLTFGTIEELSHKPMGLVRSICINKRLNTGSCPISWRHPIPIDYETLLNADSIWSARDKRFQPSIDCCI